MTEQTTHSPTTPPIPSHLSPEAQEFLAFHRDRVRTPSPAPDAGVDAWLAWVAARDAEVIEMFAPMFATELPVDRVDADIDGVLTFQLRPHHLDVDASDGIFLDIHGGGLILMGGELCAATAIAASFTRPLVTWSPDYRMPPLHPYPAALEDCLAVYRRALETCGPDRLVVSGASAGGNLAAALVLRAKDEGLPMPAALVLGTPELDLTESGDTFVTNASNDTLLGSLMPTNLLYADGIDLAHPYLSPLFGDVAGFPPTILTTGTRDLYLSNTVRFHRKLRAAGIEAELHVGEAMPHGGFGPTSPENRAIAADVADFVARHLARVAP